MIFEPGTDDRQIMEAFRKNVKNRMNELNITQKDLAYYIRIPETSLRNYLNGIVIPKVTIVIKIASTLCCSVDDLLKEE